MLTGVEALTLGTPVGKAVGTGVAKVAAPTIDATKRLAQQTAIGGMLALREILPTVTSSRATAALVESRIGQQAVTQSIAPAVATPVAEALAPRAVATAVPSIAEPASATVLGSVGVLGAADVTGTVVQGRITGSEVFEELSSELGMSSTSTVAGDVASAAADAQRAGLIGSRGAPGTADIALQPHGGAAQVRGAYGISGQQGQSAHVGATSFLRDVPGYSRSRALTTILDPATHRAFDATWKAWAIAQRQAGRTMCEVRELRVIRHRAIDQIPGMPAETRNALAWIYDLEITALGLADDALIPLPYPNIRAVMP